MADALIVGLIVLGLIVWAGAGVALTCLLFPPKLRHLRG